MHLSTKATAGPTRRRRPRRIIYTWKWVKLSEAKKGFVLLPKRWVVERSNAWAAHFRRLAPG